jgi:hypothetical protein
LRGAGGNQGLDLGFGAGLRFPDALALATNVCGQAFQRRSFAHGRGGTLDAQNEGTLPMFRTEIEVAGFHNHAVLSRGSCSDRRNSQGSDGEQSINTGHDRFLQHCAADQFERRGIGMARSATWRFPVSKSDWSFFETRQADGIRTGWVISKSACRADRALAAMSP